ncbi:hypothetical protein AYI69_g4181 [Smittium culicis]|uniref:Homologous recombination OB-fold protein OB-fold domain-containing protein n=1 Tax=Smittium culicis TaxID=133412 RepID=A0A1R1YFV8_9FUNG|nr:hypothetical protein AYI69_g4181 [Smittium culicis]
MALENAFEKFKTRLKNQTVSQTIQIEKKEQEDSIPDIDFDLDDITDFELIDTFTQSQLLTDTSIDSNSLNSFSESSNKAEIKQSDKNSLQNSNINNLDLKNQASSPDSSSIPKFLDPSNEIKSEIVAGKPITTADSIKLREISDQLDFEFELDGLDEIFQIDDEEIELSISNSQAYRNNESTDTQNNIISNTPKNVELTTTKPKSTVLPHNNSNSQKSSQNIYIKHNLVNKEPSFNNSNIQNINLDAFDSPPPKKRKNFNQNNTSNSFSKNPPSKSNSFDFVTPKSRPSKHTPNQFSTPIQNRNNPSGNSNLSKKSGNSIQNQNIVKEHTTVTSIIKSASRSLISSERGIPGPANFSGSTNALSRNNSSLINDSDSFEHIQVNNDSPDPKYQASLEKSSNISLLNDQDFDSVAWKYLLNEFDLPEYKPSTLADIDTSLEYFQWNIQRATLVESPRLIPYLLVLVNEYQPADIDSAATLIDPTGEISASIHHGFFQVRGNSLTVGSSILLKNVPVMKARDGSSYLVMTAKNTVKVFTPNYDISGQHLESAIKIP